MRHWGRVVGIAVSAFLALIASAAFAAPAHAATAPVDPVQAAAQFLDAANAARASVGVGPLAWRDDVAVMALSQSMDMAQQGTIFHGSFVSSENLRNLNASTLGENVGTGSTVSQIHDAFMNSEHHRANILDAGFNQVGIAVAVVGRSIYVTEDFLFGKGSGTAQVAPAPKPAPKPAAVPTTAKPAPTAPKAPKPVAAAPKKVAPPTTAAPTTTAPPPAPTSTAPPTTEATVVVDAFVAAPAAAPAKAASQAASAGPSVLASGLGVLLLLGAVAGHVVVRRRRPTS